VTGPLRPAQKHKAQSGPSRPGFYFFLAVLVATFINYTTQKNPGVPDFFVLSQHRTYRLLISITGAVGAELTNPLSTFRLRNPLL